MTYRTTESTVTFRRPFHLSSMVVPLPAGTYKLTVDEEVIEGLSFLAYQKTASNLHIPAIGVASNTSQYLQVDGTELQAAIDRDEAGAAL